jgi:hypothetical protein
LEVADEVSRFHEVLKGYLLRRCKEDVETAIPPKEETLIEVELTFVQKQYYRAILEKNVKFLRAGAQKKTVPQLLNIGMELRKLCNHPFLVKGARDKLEAEAGGGAEAEVDALVKTAGKFVLLDKLLPKLRADGHKVLIFTQMVQLLHLLEDYLSVREIPHEVLHGSISANDRESAIRRFNDEPEAFAFLLSTRAGGLGINLVSADTVIIFDSDWNPQNDLQAQARCHRIGQTNAVKVYRLVSTNTYEMQLFQRASRKLGLDRVLRHYEQTGGDAGAKGGKFDAGEVEQMLRYGTVGVLEGGDDEQQARSSRFLESDIEQILESSSRMLKYEGVLGEAKGNVFAKASFLSEGGGDGVSLSDPEFWATLLPDASTNATRLLASLEQLGDEPPPELVASVSVKIEELVAPVVDARANGERPDETDPVLELLSAVVGIPAFGLPQLAKFREWAAAIERPKRRRMRPVSYFEGDTKLGRDDEMFVQDASSASSSEEDDIDAAAAELALMTIPKAEAARKVKEHRRREAAELAQLNRSRTDERQGEKKAQVEARQKAMKQYQKLFKFPGRKVLLCSSDRTIFCSLYRSLALTVYQRNARV